MKLNAKTIAAVTLLSAQTMGGIVLPAANHLVAYAEEPTSTTITAGQEVAEELVDSKSGLTQVLTVNGNKLTDKVTVNQGDNVTFDIVLTPGNQGLMKTFTDTLPEGLVFNPNSKAAITVYAVNNDGTVGDEITDRGKVVINGGTVSWTPETPEEFFFAGKTGTRNRLLFHITTKVASTVAAASVLTNVAETTFENPKDPDNPPTPVTDKAEVEIPANPSDPGIQKSVYKEAADGSIDLQLPTTNEAGETQPAAQPAKLAYEFSSNGKTLVTGDVDQFLAQVTRYATQVTEYTGGAVDVAPINTALEAYKADGSQENLVKLGEAIKATEEAVAKVKGSAASTSATAANKHDNITLEDLAEKYTYVLDVKLPSKAISKSLVIRDDIEGVQAVNPEDVRVYNSKGEDVTTSGAVKVETRKDTKVVTWTASEAYIKELNATNTDKSLQVRISGVNVTEANKDDLAKLKTGGVISIPNVAKVIADGIEFESNETLVRLPEDPDNPTSTITKGVKAQEGKVDPKTGAAAQKTSINVPLDENGNVKLPEGDDGGVIVVTNSDDYATLKANTEKAIARAKVFGVDTSALEAELAKLTEQSTSAEKANVVRAFQAMSKAYDEVIAKFKAEREAAAAEAAADKVAPGTQVAEEIKFEEGQTSLDATQDTYFKYLINTSVNPGEIGDYLQITDPMDGIQSVSAENVRLYDATGADITDSFKVGVEEKDGKKVVTARANEDYLKTVKASKTNVRIQLVVYNVQAKTDKAANIKNTADLELGTDKKITSNETVVNLKVDDPVKPVENVPSNPDPSNPNNPADPAKPDVKTGASIASNPLAVIGVIGALGAGAAAVFFSRKKKQQP